MLRRRFLRCAQGRALCAPAVCLRVCPPSPHAQAVHRCRAAAGRVPPPPSGRYVNLLPACLGPCMHAQLPGTSNFELVAAVAAFMAATIHALLHPASAAPPSLAAQPQQQPQQPQQPPQPQPQPQQPQPPQPQQQPQPPQPQQQQQPQQPQPQPQQPQQPISSLVYLYMPQQWALSLLEVMPVLMLSAPKIVDLLLAVLESYAQLRAALAAIAAAAALPPAQARVRSGAQHGEPGHSGMFGIMTRLATVSGGAVVAGCANLMDPVAGPQMER
eukprot:202560-Chlamydomonas_euryale.AAC.1